MKTVFIILLSVSLVIADQVEKLLINSNNLFTAAVYRELSLDLEKNFLVSPFSAETVLALVQEGAKGQTAEELRSSLKLLKDQHQIKEAFKALLPHLKVEDQDYSFHVANKLYLEENFAIRKEFAEVARDVFYTDLENIEFSENVKAAETINQWVEKETENKIHNLVGAGDLDATTIAVIVNALYFKGNWSIPFEHFATEKDKFYQVDKQVVEVQMMHHYGNNYNFYESKELKTKFLEIPFVGENVSMVFVLPNERNGITDLENNIYKIFAQQDFAPAYVNVSLPKFKIESKLDFKEILKNLGASRAFTPAANFSGISVKNLFVSNVIQKTFIDVNEDGVEAAASTFGEITLFSGHYYPPEVIQFHADHPFIFYIKVKDLIVFAGRVKQPSYN